MRKVVYGLVGILVLMVGLVACGDATNTVPAATVGSNKATTTGGSMPVMTSGAMPGMTAGATMAGSIMSGDDPMTASLKGLSGKEFEVSFMQQMIVHHQSAIDMAKLVATNTKRPELLKLGQDIITAQTKEIGDMTGWLTTWYSAKPVTDAMSVPGMMQMMGDMNTLKSAKDNEFDKQFLKMMTDHHQQAVNMANLLSSKTQRPELLKLGQDIIKTQTSEISQMKDWQKAWSLQ